MLQKLNKIKNINSIFVLIGIILIISLFSVLKVIAKPEKALNGDNEKMVLTNNNIYKTVDKISSNKVIIVGDSRMEYIKNKENELNIPNNFIFDAKGGAGITWAIETGLPKLKELLKERNDDYYHVVFNLGVNDLNGNINVKNRADKYIKLYNEIIKGNKNVVFYFLSVNPIDEEIIYDVYYTKRSNRKIEEFNSYFAKYANEDKFDNVKYCDSYNNLKFTSPDGLHYDTETDQKIIDYIVNDCIEYE